MLLESSRDIKFSFAILFLFSEIKSYIMPVSFHEKSHGAKWTILHQT